jgi:hypothetical protein
MSTRSPRRTPRIIANDSQHSPLCRQRPSRTYALYSTLPLYFRPLRERSMAPRARVRRPRPPLMVRCGRKRDRIGRARKDRDEAPDVSTRAIARSESRSVFSFRARERPVISRSRQKRMTNSGRAGGCILSGNRQTGVQNCTTVTANVESSKPRCSYHKVS